MFDVVIIGGGPSGLMAAVAASGAGASTLLIDKGDKLGRKLGISGGGRCNVTNANEMDELIRNIPGNGRFLFSALNQFGNKEIIAFFEGMGIALKEEDRGRMFPVSDKAKTVVDALLRKVREQGVEIRTNMPVKEVLYENGAVKGIRLASNEVIDTKSVIIATGGKSVPHTGSTGDGYPWAKKAGHTITDLYPTEVPLTSAEPWIRSKELQGLSLRNVTLTVWNAKNKKLVSHEGDMIFTHFGLSGPAALRCSQFVVKELKKASDSEDGRRNVLVTIDLLPDRSEAEIFDETLKLAKLEPKKAVKNVLRGYVQERLLELLLRQCEINGDITYDNIPREPWRELAKRMKQFPVAVNGTLSIEEAFVTGGGVHLKEIDPKTMQSKLVHGLYFCGEVLDIHGYTGGYNITAAFTTGHSAGTSAASAALSS
ncbi:NAD(P)/FAD-dependent oxidoreductase [Paenibacillus glycanilyticus]|uniref:NAD(P)/FAD-dependent oxidoreductase n=1 Tax=Paenibacillus glycanilyticus TaxID=126569 RepID=UPI002041A77F|nr:NAD(P)/FAD-dependent oxidoreductase [Paenibacillus glycanilyticus]MCM3630521.1 NAD(P)/FAD-dependent oxidoreductase [Paenibacillus glycanilyticus]